jgi:hypothetical protein
MMVETHYIIARNFYLYMDKRAGDKWMDKRTQKGGRTDRRTRDLACVYCVILAHVDIVIQNGFVG